MWCVNCAQCGEIFYTLFTILSPPARLPEQVPGGRDFVYAKQLDRARRNFLKPTSRPISECSRSRPNPFLACVMQLLCSRTCSPSHALVGQNRTARLRLHAPPRLASPSRRERGECSAAKGHRRRRLQVRRRPAPPEPTGPRHRGRLAGDRPKKRNCAFTRSKTHLAIWTSSMRLPLLCRS